MQIKTDTWTAVESLLAIETPVSITVHKRVPLIPCTTQQHLHVVPTIQPFCTGWTLAKWHRTWIWYTTRLHGPLLASKYWIQLYERIVSSGRSSYDGRLEVNHNLWSRGRNADVMGRTRKCKRFLVSFSKNFNGIVTFLVWYLSICIFFYMAPYERAWDS